jgi:hypothetical protein
MSQQESQIDSILKVHLEHSTMLQTLNEKVIEQVNQYINKLVIEGLAYKGFKFENPADLIPFIKEHCSVNDNEFTKERVYSVKGKPFLIHFYKESFVSEVYENYAQKITAGFGYYSFI